MLPSSRAGIATGMILGIGRIAGDTAIVFLLLGGTLAFGSGADWCQPGNWGDTMRTRAGRSRATSTSPRRSAKATPKERSYGAAFMLIVIIV